MVAIVSGNSLGLNLTSLSTLGQQGIAGSLREGRSGEAVVVNLTTGNLLVQAQDASLVGRGTDQALLRTYNRQGLLNANNANNWSTGPFAQPLTITGAPNAAGSSVARVDMDGSTATYSYDAARGLYVTTAGDGAYDTLAFIAADAQWEWRDGSTGAAQRYQGSGSFKLLSSRDANGLGLTYQYLGPDGALSSVTTANGEQTLYDWAAAGQLRQVRTVDAAGVAVASVLYEQGADGISAVTVDLTPADNSTADGKTYRTSYAYDAARNLVRITQMDGTELAFTYAGTRIATVADALGNVTRFEYTAASGATPAFTNVIDALGLVTRYEFDTAGQLTKIVPPAVDGAAATRQFTYNANGDLTSVVDGEGRAVTFQYDSNGNQVLQRDHAGNTVTRTFDTRNQLLTESSYAVADPDGAGAAQPSDPLTARYAYDGTSRNLLRFEVSAEGRVTEHRYNGFGERVASIAYRAGFYPVTALSAAASIPLANLVAWAAARDQSAVQRMEYAYDGRGQLQTRTSYAQVTATGVGIADGSHTVERYVHDARGRLLQTVSGTGGTTTFSHDALGRVLTHRDASGQLTLTQYDDAANTTVLTLANGLVTTSAYDRAGRLATVVQGTAAATLGQTRYFYDADHRLTITQDPTGVRNWILYDAAGRRAADIDGNGTMTEYTYDRERLLTSSVTYAAAVTMPTAPAAGQQVVPPALASLRPAASAGDVREWRAYDAAARLVRVARTVGSGNTAAVTETRYDGASRVAQVVGYANSIATDTGLVAAGSVGTPAASAQDRVTRHFYDGDGRLTGTLDAEGYLAVFTWNAAGQQVQRAAYATATSASLRASGTLAQLQPAAAGADIRSFSFHDGKGQLVADVDGEGYLTEYAYDANGNLARTVRYGNRAVGTVTVSSALAALRPAASNADRTATRTYDVLGRLAQETSPEGTITRHGYDSQGQLVSTLRAAGCTEERMLLSRYDAQGRLVAELSAEAAASIPAGATQAQADAVWAQYATTHAYDAAGRKVSTTNPLGHRTLFFYNLDGALTHTVNALGEVQENRYDPLGRLAERVVYTGRIGIGGLTGGLVSAAFTTTVSAIANAAADSRATFTYARDSRLATSTDALGQTTTHSYNAFGEDKARTEGSLTLSFTVDRRGLQTGTASDPAGLNATTSTAYDAFGRVTRTVDANGNVRERAFDRLGRTVTTRDANGALRSSTYDAFARQLTHTDALNNVTRYDYDTGARTLTVTTPEGVVTRTAYTRHGQVQSVTDGRGENTSYTYDRNGNLRQTSTSLTTDFRTYDAADRLKETTDANGNKVAYIYDAANRVLTRRLDPNGLNLTTSWAYDGKGQQVSTTDPNGVVTTIAYDRKGQVLKQTVDPTGLNLQTTYSYDTRGNTLTVTSPQGTVTQYAYDNLGRRTQERVDPAGLNLTRSWTYDRSGNVLSSTDASGALTRHAYDGAGQLVFTVDPLGTVRQTVYDPEGRVTKTVAYAVAVSTSALGTNPSAASIQALVSANPVQDAVEHRVHDKDGHVLATVDGTGAVVRYTYDANGNVVSRVAYVTPIASWTPGTVPAPVADAVHDARLDTVYDALNRAVYTVDGTRAVVAMRYDGNGNALRRTAYATPLPAGVAPQDVPTSAADRITSMAYDAANRLVFEVDALHAVAEQAYDANGNIVRRTAYAAPLSAMPTVGSSPSAIRASLAALPAEDRTTRYGYDAANRQALAIDATGAATELKYDRDGHVTTHIGYAACVNTAGLTDGARLASLQALLMPSSASDRITRQAYDAAGRLAYALDATGAVRWTEYDGAGRVARTTRYALRPVLAAYSAADIATAMATRASPSDQVEQFRHDAGGRLVGTTDALGSTEAYEYDALGRRTNFTNKNGAIWTYGYDPAGRLLVETSPQLTLTSVAGDMTTSTVPGSVVTRLSYDALGNLVSRTEAAGRPEERTTRHGYDAVGRQVSVTHAKTWVYDPQKDMLVTEGLAAAAESEAFLQTRTIYDALGNAVANVDVGNALSQKAYDRLGRVRYEVDALGFVTGYQRNAFGEVLTLTRYAAPTALASRGVGEVADAVQAHDVENALAAVDPTFDRTLTSSYDGAGRVTETADLAGYVYDPSALAAHQTGLAGRTTRTGYSAFGEAALVRSLRNAAAGTWSDITRQFDSAGREIGVVDALGYLATRSYDTFGNLLRVTEFATAAASAANPDNRVIEYTYDRANRKLQERRLNVEFSAASDGSSTRGDLVTSYGYDKVGNQTSVADAGGNVTRTYYDVLGRVRAIASPPRAAQTAAGELSVSPLTAYLRDAHGNAVSEVVYANGARDLTDSGYTLTATSSADRRILTRYDELGRATRVRDAAEADQFFSYDAYGNLAKRWQAVTGNDAVTRTTYEVNVYDKVGHLVETHAPASTMVAQGGLRAEWTKSTTPATTLSPATYSNRLVLGWANLVDPAGGTVRVEATYMTAAGWSSEDPTVWQPSAAVTLGKDLTPSAAAGGTELTWQVATGSIAYIRVLQSMNGVWTAKWQGSMAEATGAGVADLTQAQVGQFVTSMEYNGFGEMTRRGTQWGRQEYFDYDAAGRLWRTNTGDGIDRIQLYDAQGNQTADIRSAGSARGNVDMRAVADAAAANTSLYTRRTDTVFDAMGRVVSRTEAARPEYQDGVVVQRTVTAASVLETATFTGEGGGVWGIQDWSGQNRVALSWNSLGPLGSGDVKVQIDYRTSVFESGGYYDEFGQWKPPVQSGGTNRSYTSPAITVDKAAAGATLSWNETSTTSDGGISAIARLIVWKKDVYGVWQEVINQAPGYGTHTIDLAAPGGLRTTEFLEVRLAGSSNAWETASVIDFGDRRRYLGTYRLNAGTYEYRMGVNPPGEPGRIVSTGTFTLTSGTPAQGATQNTGAYWQRPVVNQKADRWGNVTEISDPRSAAWVTRYRYNANNQLVEQTQPDEAGAQGAASPATRIYYDFAGRQVAVRDANGHVNGQRFNAAGDLVTEVHADAGVVTHRFNVFGEKVGTTDAETHVQSFTYDKMGRMTSVQKGTARVYQVDGSPTVIASTLRPITESWTYDQAGRRLTHVNGNNEKVSYRYDLRGNLVETMQPLGQKSRTAYDANGRKRAEVDANNYAATWTYDYFGLLVAHDDLGGARYTYTYDAARQLIAQTNTGGQSLRYDYDAAGQVVAITDWANNKVTTYVYDLSGRKLREKVVQDGVTYQDNHLGYDALGRLRDIADARVHMGIVYDKVGNRTRIASRVNYQGTGGETLYNTDRFFQYDAMNRQVVVDAVDAAGTLGNDGHRLNYDKNGNRTGDTHWGDRIGSANFETAITGYNVDGDARYSTSVTYTNTRYWTTEVYKYDNLNRLQGVERDGVQVDLRYYDGADRVVQSGPPANLPAGYRTLVKQAVEAHMMQPLDFRINRYDANGRLMHQQARDMDMALKASTSWDPIEIPFGRSDLAAPGYDAAGNVVGYTMVSWPSGSTTRYTTEFARFDNYQARLTSGVSTDLQPGKTVLTYDVNGFLGLVNDGTLAANDRRLVNDASGRALFVDQGGKVQRQLIVNGEVMGTYGVGVDPIRPKWADGNPNFANLVDFDFSYQGISPTYPSPAPGAYQVRSGDTLQTIAQSAYGDGSLWFRIAEANGLRSSNDMRVGQTLNIPNRVSAVHNNDGTFKPYDPSRIAGDMTPNMPMPAEEGGCGGVGRVLMVIVAIVVAIYTTGAAVGFFGGTASAGASTFGAGLAALGGGSAAGVSITTAAGASMSIGAVSAASAAVGAAVGSVASQAVGIAAGVQDKFNWKSVGLSALSAGVTSGVGAYFTPPGGTLSMSTPAVVGRAVISNMVTQGVGVAVGLQKRFDWRGVASSAVGATVGNELVPAFRTVFKDSALAQRFATGLIAGAAAAAARGGRVVVQQVAMDAFGNALGESLVNVMSNHSTRVMGAGGARDSVEYGGEGLKLSQAQVDAWRPKFNVPDDPLGRPAWDLFAGGTPKLSSARGAYGVRSDVMGFVDPDTGATTYPVRTPVIESYPLPPMEPLPRRPMPEPSVGQYVYGRVVETMDSITESLDRMGEDPSTPAALRFAAAMVRNPARWIPGAVKGLAGGGGYAFDSQFRSQINTAVGDFFGNDPVGTTKAVATRYWDENSGLEIVRDTFNFVAGGSIGTPLAKLPGLVLGETASLLGKAGETGLRWSQRLNDYSFDLVSVPSMRYQVGAIGVTVRNLRAEVTQMLPEGFGLQRISRGGAVVLRYGEDTYYSVPKTQYSLIPELRTMDTMGDVFTGRVQRIADRFDLSMLSREQQLRLNVTPDGWMKVRFLSSYKGSNVHTTFARELQLVPGGAAYSYSWVGPDVVGRIGGTGLKYEITQLTPSLNAIYSHTKKYPDQLLRYVTYR